MNNQPNEDIIDKVINGMASEEEAKSVAIWFSTDAGQKYLSKRIDKEVYIDKDLLKTVMDNTDIPSDEIYRNIEKRLSKKKYLKIFRYAAAILLPLIVLGWGIMRLDDHVSLFGDTEYVEVYVPKGEHLQVMFHDGSKAYLNSDTKVRYPKKFGLSDRKIFLDGEGYFTIEKNSQRPFIIEMDSIKVKVLGTTFNLHAYSSENTISLNLDNGKVNLYPISNNKEFSLMPGERIVYNKYSGDCQITSNISGIPASSWKDDIIYLKEKPLADVLRVLDRKYNIQFKIEDKESLKYNYTILISKNTPLAKVLYDLEQIAPVSFQQDGDSIKVLIKKK